MGLVAVRTMKIGTVTFIFLVALLICQNASFGHSIIKKVTCRASNITVRPDYKCNAKAFSRADQRMNVFFNLVKPIYDFYVSLDVSYKTTTNSYRSIINSTMDICGYLNGTSSNPLAKYYVDMVRNSVPPGFIHPCPYSVSRYIINWKWSLSKKYILKGVIQLSNYSVTKNFHGLLYPDGIYKLIVRYFYKYDKNIATILVITEHTGSTTQDF